MYHKTRKSWWILVVVSGISALGALIHQTVPTMGTVALFFFILGATSYFLFAFLFLNRRRAALATSGVLVLFALRAAGLREPIYAILLTAALIAIELVFHTR